MDTRAKEYRAIRALIDEACALKEGPEASLKEVYEHPIKAHSREIASIYFDEDGRKKTMDYATYGRRSLELAARLSPLLRGLPAGPVALKMRNSENWPLLFWAILMNGRDVLLLDFRLQRENAANLLRQAGAQAVIASEIDPYEIKTIRLNEIMGSYPDGGFEPHFASRVYFASSGTTGEAKLIVMGAANLVAQIKAAANLPEENLLILNAGKTRNLAMIPFHHIFGFVAVFLWYSYYGLGIVYPSSTSTRDVLDAIRVGKCTHVYSVPMFWDGVAKTLERSIALKGEKMKTLFEKRVAYGVGEISKKEAGFAGSALFERLLKKKAFGTSILWCISGGGAISKKTLRLVNGIGYPLANGYGMTEIGVACVEKREDAPSRLGGSIGTLFHGFEAKIRDGKEEGELLLRSPTVHEEEIIGGKPRKTPLEDGGYFATGDIVRIEDGRLYIKGRLKDTIIDTNGENVYPDEIEDSFRGLPHAKNVACFGLEEGGRERICLAIEMDNVNEKDALEKTRSAFESINAGLPNEKKVASAYMYRKSLPISGSMKVKRFQLRDELKSGSKDFVPLSGIYEEKKEDKERFASFDELLVKEVRKKTRRVFSENLQLLEEKIAYDDVWDKDLGGDSMSYVAMVSDLNDVFGIEFPVELYGKVGTVDDFAYQILLLLKKRG